MVRRGSKSEASPGIIQAGKRENTAALTWNSYLLELTESKGIYTDNKAQSLGDHLNRKHITLTLCSEHHRHSVPHSKKY